MPVTQPRAVVSESAPLLGTPEATTLRSNGPALGEASVTADGNLRFWLGGWPLASQLGVAVALVCYISVSAGMIIYNKYILFTLKFPRPLLLTCSHMLFAIVATQLVQALAGVYAGPGQTSYLSRAIGRRPKVSTFFFMTRIVPIGVFFAMNLWLSNLALVYISISLTAMLKKTSIILVMLASFAVNLLDPSWAKVSAALVVTVGVVVATYHEVDASAQGIAFQLLAVISDVLRLVLINLLLRQEQHTLNPFHSLRLFAPCCALCLLPLLLAYEGIPPLQRVLEVGPWLLTGNLLLSFAVNICLLIVVQVTSSTVLTFAGVGKDIVLLSVSYFGFGAPIQAMQLIGYAISVVGLLVYKKNGRRQHICGCERVRIGTCGSTD